MKLLSGESVYFSNGGEYLATSPYLVVGLVFDLVAGLVVHCLEFWRLLGRRVLIQPVRPYRLVRFFSWKVK